VAPRNPLTELWAARSALWDLDHRRRQVADAVSSLLDRPHSQHEYLFADLEIAHAHMVGRDLAERAVVAALDAPRPPKRDTEEARRLLGDLLSSYGWHRGELERTVAFVRDRHEEAARRARRAASPPAPCSPP